MNWLHYLVLLPALLVSITVHEFAHAWSASLLGDDYARRLGRVSLNPLRHLTPLGTLAILLLPFGWGKPVPVNLYNFKHPRRDYLLSSLAGPAANILLVAICLGLMLLTQHCYRYGLKMVIVLVCAHFLLLSMVIMNGILAALNLIPIPPLDGSKIWPYLLGRKATSGGKVSRVFLIVLMVLLFRGTFKPYLNAVSSYLTEVMPQSDLHIYYGRLDAGSAAQAAGQWDQAQGYFSEALAIDPWSTDALVGRSAVRMQQGDLEGSLQDMDQAIRLAPDAPELHEMRATLLARLGRIKEMREERAAYKRLRHPAGSQPASSQP